MPTDEAPPPSHLAANNGNDGAPAPTVQTSSGTACLPNMLLVGAAAAAAAGAVAVGTFAAGGGSSCSSATPPRCCHRDGAGKQCNQTSNLLTHRRDPRLKICVHHHLQESTTMAPTASEAAAGCADRPVLLNPTSLGRPGNAGMVPQRAEMPAEEKEGYVGIGKIEHTKTKGNARTINATGPKEGGSKQVSATQQALSDEELVLLML